MRGISRSDVAPRGMELEHLTVDRERVSIDVRTVALEARCPSCGRGSRRVHGQYHRTVSDLPRHGVPVALRVQVRRFFWAL